MLAMDFFGSHKFPMFSNGGGSGSKASDDCCSITGGAGKTGWSSFSSLLLTECNYVTWTCSEFDDPKILMKRSSYCNYVTNI